MKDYQEFLAEMPWVKGPYGTTKPHYRRTYAELHDDDKAGRTKEEGDKHRGQTPDKAPELKKMTKDRNVMNMSFKEAGKHVKDVARKHKDMTFKEAGKKILDKAKGAVRFVRRKINKRKSDDND